MLLYVKSTSQVQANRASDRSTLIKNHKLAVPLVDFKMNVNVNKPGQGSSQSKRAVAAREWRVHKREKRRFNTLLSGFISVKYDSIYSEYSDFFNSLNQTHPEARDLTKTKTYKKWKKEQESSALPGESVETVPHDRPETFDSLPVQPDVLPAVNEILQDLPNEDFTHDRSEHPEPFNSLPAQPDVLSAVVDEILPANDAVNINEVDDIIDEIINDLQQDDVIRDLLNAENNGELVRPHYEDEDEGIGLNTETELEYVLEPFDYELEVEGVDF